MFDSVAEENVWHKKTVPMVDKLLKFLGINVYEEHVEHGVFMANGGS